MKNTQQTQVWVEREKGMKMREDWKKEGKREGRKKRAKILQVLPWVNVQKTMMMLLIHGSRGGLMHKAIVRERQHSNERERQDRQSATIVVKVKASWEGTQKNGAKLRERNTFWKKKRNFFFKWTSRLRAKNEVCRFMSWTCFIILFMFALE